MNANATTIVAAPVTDLHPALWRPRSISDERFENLCAPLEADPDFLWFVARTSVPQLRLVVFALRDFIAAMPSAEEAE